jgi:hypothetical protein
MSMQMNWRRHRWREHFNDQTRDANKSTRRHTREHTHRDDDVVGDPNSIVPYLGEPYGAVAEDLIQVERHGARVWGRVDLARRGAVHAVGLPRTLGHDQHWLGCMAPSEIGNNQSIKMIIYI